MKMRESINKTKSGHPRTGIKHGRGMKEDLQDNEGKAQSHAAQLTHRTS
jgi:hypothetical protein